MALLHIAVARGTLDSLRGWNAKTNKDMLDKDTLEYYIDIINDVINNVSSIPRPYDYEWRAQIVRITDLEEDAELEISPGNQDTVKGYLSDIGQELRYAKGSTPRTRLPSLQTDYDRDGQTYQPRNPLPPKTDTPPTQLLSQSWPSQGLMCPDCNMIID